MSINFIEASSDELYLYALAHPEEFKGDIMKRMLERKDAELSMEVRQLMQSQSAKTAALIELLLNDSQKARHPSTQYSQTYEGKTHSRVELLEKVRTLLASQND